MTVLRNHKTWIIPVFLLFLCLISFAPSIRRLGFYWDDWPTVWFLHFLGPSSFTQNLSTDRPLLGWVYWLTTSLIGESPLNWQLFAIFTRWLSVIALWWMLCGLWPGNSHRSIGIALIFAVYPGFSQSYISVTYSHVFLMYGLFLTSVGAMIWALRKPNWYWPLAIYSLLASAFGIFTIEYFFGLELLRPAFLWIVFAEQYADRPILLRKTIKAWLPYIAILLAFVIWRLLLFESPRAEITLFEQLLSNPMMAVSQLLRTIGNDILEVNFLAWLNALDFSRFYSFEEAFQKRLVWFIIISCVLCFLFLALMREPYSDSRKKNALSNTRWAIQAITLGVLALLVGGLPFWVTNLHLELKFPWDRFTLPMMLGASFLLAGILGLISRPRWLSPLILSLLVGFSVGYQYQLGLRFRQEWLSQNTFFWQLAWRAPGIQPGTVLLTSALPFAFYSDNSLTAPLNWIYAPHQRDLRQMPYLLYDIEARHTEVPPEFESGLLIHQPYRSASFTGSTSQSLVLFYSPPRCLKVMHSVDDRLLPHEPLHISAALPVSNPNWILTDSPHSAQPMPEIFGTEPEPDWCYYFEKAELARQIGDWTQVAKLADHALKIKKTFLRENASELVPFIEGYAHTGQWQKAKQISLQAAQYSDKMPYMLCDVWNRIRSNTSDSLHRQQALENIKTEFNCIFPAP